MFSDDLIPKRFAWLLLIPFPDARWELLGWDDEALELIRQYLPTGAQAPTTPCCALINADNANHSLVESRLRTQSFDVVAAFGSRRNVRRLTALSTVRDRSRVDYGLLPERNPRLAIPLNSQRACLAGLRVHRPGKWNSRFGVALACIAVKAGFRSHFGVRLTILASRSAIPARPASAIGLGLAAEGYYALYFGDDGPSPKATLIAIDSAGRSDTYIAKISRGKRGEISLAAEHRALASLASMPASISRYAPGFSKLFQVSDRLCLVQEARQREQARAGLIERAAVTFLAALHEHTRRDLDGWVACYCHGDFAMWNCFISRGELFVFDWEFAGEGVALSDAFYFVVSRHRYVYKTADPSSVHQEALAFARRVVRQACDTAIDVEQQWQKWIAAQLEKDAFYEVYK